MVLDPVVLKYSTQYKGFFFSFTLLDFKLIQGFIKITCDIHIKSEGGTISITTTDAAFPAPPRVRIGSTVVLNLFACLF